MTESGAAASPGALLTMDGEKEPAPGPGWATNLLLALGAGDIAVYPDGSPLQGSWECMI